MEFREICWCSVKLVLLFQILSLSVQNVEGQLDIPGPPYPDSHGQNRWGVKFDPRKHGPPYDKREASQNQHHYRLPPRSRRQRPYRLHRERESDSFWSPSRMRPHRGRRHRRPYRQQRTKRFYGNHLRNKGPQSYLKAYEEYKPISPITPKEKKFWDTWNSWYKKQELAMQKGFKGSGSTKIKGQDVEIHIDVDDFKASQVDNQDDDGYISNKYKHGKDCPESGWKKNRDYYMNRMKEYYSRAKSLVAFENNEDDEDDNSAKTKGEESWKIFTAIGKGMDAANGAMRGVRKVVGKSVIATGVKYGGKMAVDAVMNVGTSALTKAIKTATFG